MKHAQIKVTIVGYYLVSEDEIEAYGVKEFDPVKMAEVDKQEYFKDHDIHALIDFFPDSRPTSVIFEAVDISDVDMDC